MKECSTVSFKGQVIFVGIDVHKNSWQVSIMHCHRQIENFNMNPNPAELIRHLHQKYPEAEYRSVFEAGFSGFEAHRYLCTNGVSNIIINPVDIPTCGREREFKSDRVDSRKLARELENGSLRPIYIPPRENLELRNLVRRETALVNNITRIKNRIHGYCSFNNLPLSGWSGKAREDMERAAEKRFDYTLLSDLRELNFLRQERVRVISDERNVLKRLNLSDIMARIRSIPGIGFRSAIILLAEIWDIKRFADKDSLASYVGLAPHIFGSGEHERAKGGTNRKKKQLHYILIEAAWRTTRYDLEYRARYGRLLAKGRSPQQAISIIAKKLLLTIRAVWLQQRDFVELVPGNAK